MSWSPEMFEKVAISPSVVENEALVQAIQSVEWLVLEFSLRRSKLPLLDRIEVFISIAEQF